MFKWFSNSKSPKSLSSDYQTGSIDGRVLFSVTVLLLEIMHADHHLSSHEKQVITGLLQAHYGLDEMAAEKMFNQAEELLQTAVSLHEHTSVINDSFDYSDKLTLMNQLWRVAYSDDMLDRYEEHLIRRLADLLYVSHSDFIQQKHAVMDD